MNRKVYNKTNKKVNRLFKSLEKRKDFSTICKDLVSDSEIVTAVTSSNETYKCYSPSTSLEGMNDIAIEDDYQYMTEEDEFALYTNSDFENAMHDSDTDDEVENSDIFCDELAIWASNHNITHFSLDDLLKLLKKKGLDVPLSSKTLLKTPKNLNLEMKSGGSYIYMGISDGVKNIMKSFDVLSIDQLNLSFNIDGLPLFISSRKSFWPILCTIANVSPNKPFPVAFFSSTQKPSNLEFLQDLIEELKNLLEVGILIGESVKRVKIHSIICDAPAKALVKGIVQFNGKYGCDKCEVEGKYTGRMVFLDLNAKLRKDSSFRSKSNKEHHKVDSPFLELPIDMILLFPNDYMHLVDLGVTKKLLLLWTIGHLPFRMSQNLVYQISEKLVNLKDYTPCEFVRKPRSLSEVSMWKASEFRQFLLYTGPIVLKDIIPAKNYKHFLSLSIAMLILMNSDLVFEYCEYARDLLHYFVKNSIKLYGESFVTYNVHSLIHLPDEAQRYGSLQKISAYPFENYMQHIKRLVRSTKNPIVQVVNRLTEYAGVNKDSETVIYVLHVKPNECYLLKSGSYCLINECVNDKLVYCEILHSLGSFYPKQFINSNLIGIQCVSLKSKKKELKNVSELEKKAIYYPFNATSSIVVPFIHTT